MKDIHEATDAGSGVGDLLAHVIENPEIQISLANQSSQCLEAVRIGS
jgi:hypothetical protein